MSIEIATYGKNMKKEGIAPAIGLVNPKYAHNVGMALRIASCYGLKQVWFSGTRVSLEPVEGKGKKPRVPREERMKGYQKVQLRQFDYFIEQFDSAEVTPVAIEVRDNSESLALFEHPENALYLFGPEDGSIPKPYMHHCHRFVAIPTEHCLNLATAVATVMWDRKLKRVQAGLDENFAINHTLDENRGWIESDPYVYDQKGKSESVF